MYLKPSGGCIGTRPPLLSHMTYFRLPPTTSFTEDDAGSAGDRRVSPREGLGECGMDDIQDALDEESEKAWVGCVQDHQMHQSMAVHPLTFRSDS